MRSMRPLVFMLALGGAALPAAGDTRVLRGTLKDLATVVTPARAMTIHLGRTAADPDCGIPCARFIVADGDIRRETVGTLAALLRTLPRSLPVYLASPGGSLDAALALGHLMRSHDVEVIIARREALDMRPPVAVYAPSPEPASCLSACVYAFAGGTARRLEAGSGLGVHQFFVARPDDAARRPKESYSRADVAHVQKTVATLAGYLAGMGIGVDLLAMAADTDPAAMRMLTPQERLHLKLEQERTGFVALNTTLSPPLPHEVSPTRTFSALAPAGSMPTSTLVVETASPSRRYGSITSTLTFGCGDSAGMVSARFGERIPGRASSDVPVAVIDPARTATSLAPKAQISRTAVRTAIAAGALDVDVTSAATAGYPMRIAFDGADIAAALDELDRACR